MWPLAIDSTGTVWHVLRSPLYNGIQLARQSASLMKLNKFTVHCSNAWMRSPWRRLRLSDNKNIVITEPIQCASLKRNEKYRRNIVIWIGSQVCGKLVLNIICPQSSPSLVWMHYGAIVLNMHTPQCFQIEFAFAAEQLPPEHHNGLAVFVAMDVVHSSKAN